ncbi:hypothetical protein CCR95_10050 [Thiocystis minor]|uniref:Slp family lipoprotein n=1 Tax=Thiocystis minor TaxID=61597 RepID=UPI00191292B3|nr:Slp family lipoprotein [Thiocystis minor]MBK5964417.1 hypothetical protein [Thiocystis minor]
MPSPPLSLLSLTAMLGLLVGCASGVPQAIREDALGSPSLAEVQEQPERHRGRRIRWGGSILKVRNLAQTTEIEVLARPLNRFGEPDASAGSLGRFLIEIAGFRDPVEYPAERLLTVAGSVARVENRPVGDFPYRYPVVDGATLHLWPQPIALPPYPAPYPYPYPWYDPWLGSHRDPWFDPRY